MKVSLDRSRTPICMIAGVPAVPAPVLIPELDTTPWRFRE